MTLVDRLAALSSVVALGTGRLSDDILDGLRDLDQRAGSRLRLSGEYTVVALAGATGSGKSSLFNVVAGASLAEVGVRRPTTSATQAVVFGPDGATELLDWLEIQSRQYGDASAAPELSGLVLLDLPDHDSTEVSHRAEVDRLVRLVDAFIWVLDPQKYADAVLHDEYLRPLAAHRDVMVVALNQSDRLSAPDVAACVRDLDRLLTEDGLGGVPVLATSAVTPDGASPLREFLVATVADHKARTARVSADLDTTAARLAPLVPLPKSVPALRDAERRLQTALAGAAGVPAVVGAVGRAYERRGLAAVGWPPLRWIHHMRPDPLRRLGLGQASMGDEVLRRTSLPSASAASRAGVDSAVRSLADTASGGLPAPWPRILLEAAKSRAGPCPTHWTGQSAVRTSDESATAMVASGRGDPVGAPGCGSRRWRVARCYRPVGLPADRSPCALTWAVRMADGAARRRTRVGTGAPSADQTFRGGRGARRRRRATAELGQRVEAVGEEFVLSPLRTELSVYGELSTAVHRLSR